jgi:hypothetical protein
MFHSANSDVSEREHSRGGGGAPAAIFAPASYKNMASGEPELSQNWRAPRAVTPRLWLWLWLWQLCGER